MTTIVYDGKKIVTDSHMINEREIYIGDVKKIHSNDAGEYVTGAGCMAGVHAVAAWLLRGEEKPTGLDSLTVLHVRGPNDAVIYHSALLPIPVVESNLPIVLGSGMELAIGAYEVANSLDHAKPAEEAVFVACKFDPFSKGPLQVVNVS